MIQTVHSVFFATLLTLGFALQGTIVRKEAASRKPLLVAHRGASGYAPEHTIAAYRLAVEQGADFVEQDLQLTKDGHLVCAHDAELSRTTDVEEVFPDRATEHDVDGSGTPKRGWYVVDLTLAEIKRLDAGSWFNQANRFAAKPEFVGQRVPTLQEAIDTLHDRAGLYIEMKYPVFYKARGFDMAKMLAAVLRKNGYAEGDKARRVFIQSFWKESLLRMREVAPQYPRVQLLPMEEPGRRDTMKVSPELAREIADYAQGAGPSKGMIADAADVQTFHAAGLVIHPYTFRGTTSAVARKALDVAQSDRLTERDKVIADIQRYLALGIDGGFTDFPALWREAVKQKSAR
jgi:glycerophosphoryl diester phosphodiesterase